MTVAASKNLQTTTDKLPYTVPADPQYWQTYIRLAPLNIVGGSGMSKIQQLVRVTFHAFIVELDSTVNTAGIVAAEMFYASGQFFNNPQQIPAFDYQNNFPHLQDTAIQTIEAEAYDAVALPIGAVDFPIWTRMAADPLSVVTYANDEDNPGNLWASTFVQINGTVNGPNPVVTVQSVLQWDFAD